MSYKIEILSDDEFEALPYPETETSLGIADPETNTAYVRYTHSDELNKHLINHELEHLIEGHGGKHSNHYRNGVYYKSFGQILGSIAPFLAFIPGVGPLLSAGAGIGGGVLNARDQAKQQSAMAQPQAMPQARPAVKAQPPVSSFPSQTGQKVSPTSGNTFNNTGATGGTGALGGNLTGSPVDRLRTGFDEEMAQRQKGWGF